LVVLRRASQSGNFIAHRLAEFAKAQSRLLQILNEHPGKNGIAV